MNLDAFDFEKICINSIFCTDNECQLNHARVFAGVCIKYLRAEQQYSNKNEGKKFQGQKCEDCKLWHFKNKKFKDQVQKKTINGVFPHNLCPYSCNQNGCMFLHRGWAEKICFDNLLSDCPKRENCNFNHKSWEQLREQALAQSQIKFTNPEIICGKEKCNCNQHPALLNDYCIPYIQGLCPKKKCLKNHVDWENINSNLNQKNALKSCIAIEQERKAKLQQLPDNHDVQLLCEKSEFEFYKKWVQDLNIIDVVFIMDLTGSMKPWKEQMQNTIDKIINSFINSVNGYQVRVAFVGYRDICDVEDQIIYYHFTKKIDEIKNFIYKLETKGGGDVAEDVAAGFQQALKLNFSHHPDSILCTFLLADAPCHGRDYHNIESDTLIDKMPKNYFEQILEKYKNIKQNNFICCVKINNLTDIMYEKMKAVIPLLTITTEQKPQDLCELVGFTLRRSVTETTKKQSSIIKKNFQYIKADFQKLKLDTTNQNPNKQYWQVYHKIVEESTRKGTTSLKITKYNTELNKDTNTSSTYIFMAFDAINNREVILKIPKKLVDNQKDINDQDITQAEDEAKIRFYSSAYACQMAYFFNQRLKQNALLNEMQPLFYAHPILYFLDTPFYGMKQIYGETHITIQYLFEKYTNNQFLLDSQKYYLSAFSHFSFDASEGLLVIMDLQGCNNILTDPSIQTDYSWESILGKDTTNRRNKGIFDFQNIQHQNCSYLCEKLNLKITQGSQLNQIKCPQNLISDVYGICYGCDEFFSFDITELIKDDQSTFNLKCQFCERECQNPITQECKCCHFIYKALINQQLQSQTNLGMCEYCKKECLKLQKKICHYCQVSCQKILKQLQFNNNIIYVCENALEYLQAFQCQKCNKPYNRQSIISVEDYQSKCFTCC